MRHGSDFDLPGDCDSIIGLDANVTNRILDLRTDQCGGVKGELKTLSL